jgi:hypothetical protein
MIPSLIFLAFLIITLDCQSAPILDVSLLCMGLIAKTRTIKCVQWGGVLMGGSIEKRKVREYGLCAPYTYMK